MKTQCFREWFGIGLALGGLALAQEVPAGALTNGAVQPRNGDLTTVFQFRVTYQDPLVANLPQAVQLILDESVTNLMSAADPGDLDPRDGKAYVWNGTLPKARHRFRFATLPASSGDIARHWGPDVSDAPLDVRQFYFFLDCPADYLADDFYVGRDSQFIWAGDLNGDGYADLVHTWYDSTIQGNAHEGAVMVYYGPDFVRHDVLLHPRYPAHELFGSTVAGGGDMDGDGCDDLVVSNFGGSQRRFFVYHGRKTGPPVLVNEIPGSNSEDAKALVDVNQDGYADLVTQGSVVTVSPPDYATSLLRVRWGPGLSGSIQSTLGISGNQPFWGTLSITDRNGDGYPDFILHGAHRAYSLSVTSATWYAASGSEQVRAADGPSLSVSLLQTHDYPWLMLAIGDADGDGQGDFASGNADHTSVDWHSGPALTLRGSAALPEVTGNHWFGYFGAGNGAGSGRTTLAVLQDNSNNQDQRGVQYYWGSAASPFSSRVFLPARLVGDLNWGWLQWQFNLRKVEFAGVSAYFYGHGHHAAELKTRSV